MHRNVGAYYTKMQRSFQGSRILMKCRPNMISQVDWILIIFHSRVYKSLIARWQFWKVRPIFDGLQYGTCLTPSSWLLKLSNGTHAWKICASLLVLIYIQWPNLKTVTNTNVIDENGPNIRNQQPIQTWLQRRTIPYRPKSNRTSTRSLF